MSFDPFAVQCLTCGSRLRVSDPAIVGTIAACPKCGSMVQIDRSDVTPLGPAGQVAVGTSSVDSEAITEDAIDAARDPGAMATTSGFTGSDTESPREVNETDSDAGPLMPPAWQSARTERSRQIGLVVALSASTLFAALLFFGWFVRSWHQQSTANVVEPMIAGSDSASATTEPDPVDPTDAIAAPLGESTEVDSSPERPDHETDGTTDPESSADRESSTDPKRPATPTMVASAPPADLVPPSPIIAVEPDDASGDAPAGNDVATLQEIPPGLAVFTQLIDLAGANAAASPLAAPPTLDELQIEDAAEETIDPMMVATPPEPINIKAALAIKVAIDAPRGYPMSDMILVIGQVTGVPIQLDWVSFDLAGIDVRTPVAVDRTMKSAAELLDEIAATVDAEVRVEESMLIVTLGDQAFAEKLSQLTSLDDFGVGRDSAIKVVNGFLAAGAPTAGDKLQLGTARDDQQLAGLAVEALRRMRGVAPRVPDQRLSRWAQSTESQSIDWPLVNGGDSGPQLDAPITISGLLRRTARTNQATCIFNWFDASRRRVSPEQLVMPHAGVDAGTMMSQTLAPFEMQVRQVDAMHWWVGTAATYDRLPVLVWSPPLGDRRQDFINRLNTVMAGASPDTYRLVVDSQSDRALLLLPRFIVRQLEKIQAGIAAR